jgi:hypothetical protein
VARRAIVGALLACELAIFVSIVYVSARLVPHEMIAAVRDLILQNLT